MNDVVEQLPEREPLDFDDINSTILQLKEYPYEIKQWMILTALEVMAIVLIITAVYNHLEGLPHEGSFGTNG